MSIFRTRASGRLWFVMSNVSLGVCRSGSAGSGCVWMTDGFKRHTCVVWLWLQREQLCLLLAKIRRQGVNGRKGKIWQFPVDPPPFTLTEYNISFKECHWRCRLMGDNIGHTGQREALGQSPIHCPACCQETPCPPEKTYVVRSPEKSDLEISEYTFS